MPFFDFSCLIPRTKEYCGIGLVHLIFVMNLDVESKHKHQLPRRMVTGQKSIF